MDKDLLKGEIRKAGMTQDEAAKKIGLSLSRFNAKINETNGAEFTLGEVQRIKRILNLSGEKIEKIFLI